LTDPAVQQSGDVYTAPSRKEVGKLPPLLKGKKEKKKRIGNPRSTKKKGGKIGWDERVFGYCPNYLRAKG